MRLVLKPTTLWHREVSRRSTLDRQKVNVLVTKFLIFTQREYCHAPRLLYYQLPIKSFSEFKLGLLKKGYTHSSSMIRKGTKRHFKMAIKSQEWMIPNKDIWKKPFQQIEKEHMSDYQEQDAILIARCMMQIRDKFNTNEGLCFIQQYYINQGLKKFGEAGKAGVDKELKQMLMRNCFTPEFVKDMTESERKKAQVAMMLLAEKHTGEIKGRLVYRGDGTREWLSREDTASPTASQEAITTTCVVDAHEGRDMMSLDVPNAFIQTFMPEIKDGEERIYMKITGIMVQILIDMAPEYREYVVLENGKRVIYVKVLRAIYGMLQSSSAVV